ncbi:MAG TPA: hypothetical protein VN848_09245 [Gemmatimonadales bacterium]|nr:hypothetical protein [Gemmatimonadales bacterium]
MKGGIRRPARAADPHQAFTVRVPLWLMKTVKAEAQKNRITANAYLIQLIDAAVDPMNVDRRDAVLAKRLRSIDEQLGALAWSQRTTLESVGALATVVLGYLPEAKTREERHAVHDKSERRFPKFTRQVAEAADGRQKGYCAALDEEFERNTTRRDTPALEEIVQPEAAA